MAASTTSTFAIAANRGAPSRERLRAWPSLSQAAQLLDLSLSALSRAMDAKKLPKHKLGGRARKIAPVALLDLAVEYGADVAKVADQAICIAERSGVAAPLIAATEQDIGAWFADQAMQATGPQDDQLAALIDAMRDAIGADAAQDILARAGVTPADATASGRRPSARRR
ncbi:MAG TPA: hypothetical protein VFC30_04900 [Solirubrobacteraceae bacterium]|nr:hypothetical protein [Solirubrobacteraceae bacterium]